MDYLTISPEDLLIACLRTGSETAWAEFMRRFHSLIASAIVRVARKWGETSPEVIDDLIQETYLKLCGDRHRLLQGFKPAHKDAAFGYVRVFAANLAHDHFKAQRSQKRGGIKPATSIDTDEASRSIGDTSAEAMDRNVLFSQITNCLQRIVSGPNAERDQRIFWLYYHVGLAASAIATLPTIELSTKGVESTLARLTREVRQRLMDGAQEAKPDSSEKGILPAESL